MGVVDLSVSERQDIGDFKVNNSVVIDLVNRRGCLGSFTPWLECFAFLCFFPQFLFYSLKKHAIFGCRSNENELFIKPSLQTSHA